MTRFTHWFIALLLLLPLNVTGQDKDAAKKEIDRLQGMWQLVLTENEGKENPLEESSVLRNWEVKGNTATCAKVKLTFKITLDPSTTPKTLELTNTQNDQVWEGIYEFKDNRWRMCLNVNPGARQRPLEFATKDKAGIIIVVLEREAK